MCNEQTGFPRRVPPRRAMPLLLAAAAAVSLAGFRDCPVAVSIGRCVKVAATGDPLRKPECDDQGGGCQASTNADYGSFKKTAYGYETCHGSDSNVLCEVNSCRNPQLCLKIEHYEYEWSCRVGGDVLETTDVEVSPPCETVPNGGFGPF